MRLLAVPVLLIALVARAADSSAEVGVGELLRDATMLGLNGPDRNLSDYRGQPLIINVWASWCPNCRVEHPMVTEFARQNIIPVYGLNYKDEDATAKAWLNQFGDPYTDILVDSEGLVGIDFGVYGAPESFLVDGNGIIRHKIVGELNPQNIQNELLPMIEKYKNTVKN